VAERGGGDAAGQALLERPRQLTLGGGFVSARGAALEVRVEGGARLGGQSLSVAIEQEWAGFVAVHARHLE
jgi:hypothetical protein